MANINALLAQGFNPMPAGQRANALMQVEQLDAGRQRNALMQFQMQQAQAEAAQKAELQRTRANYFDSISPERGPARPVDGAQAIRAGVLPAELKVLQGAEEPGQVVVPAGASLLRGGKLVHTSPFKETPPPLPPLAVLQQYRDTIPQGDPRRREVQGAIDNATRPPKFATPGAGPAVAPPKPPKPLPAGAMKMQQESLDKIGIASSINADLDGIAKQIEGGKLSFGPVSNLLNTGRNMAGMSSEESRNFGTFKSTLERLRNESLRLNTGVQTDGDAQRAWNELFQNINDTGLVKQRLAEIQAINKRGADLQRLRVDSIRNEYGAEPLDASAYEKQPSAIAKPGGMPDMSAIEAEIARRRGGK